MARSSTIAKQIETPPEVPALPDTKERQRVESRLGEIRRDYGEDTEIRLRALYELWRNPLGPKSLTKAQLDELIRFGIVKNDIQKPVNDGLALQCSMQDMAAYLTKKYGAESDTGSKKIYYAREISEWVKIGAPKPGRNKLLNSQDFLRWFEQNKLATGDGGSAGGITIAEAEAAKRETAVIENAKKKEEFKQYLRETSGLYILTATSTRTGAGLGIVARNATRDLLEKQLVPKYSIGLDAIIPDEAQRQAALDKLRRDAVELLADWQNNYRTRAEEILKQGMGAEGTK